MGNGHSTHTCPTVDESGPPIQSVVGSLTFHKLAIIISGAAAVWTCVLALILVFRHATHFSNPPEQKQIIRIINILPCFALVTLLCVWLDGSEEPYIVPALDVGEAFPMAAFFLLMSAYLVPEEGDREAFFTQLEMIDKKGNSSGIGSLQWYKKLSILVTQWIPVSIILWIATVITLASGSYCTTSNNPHFAHIWITIFRMISTALAIVAILRFYKRSKPDLKPRGTLKQLICFKIIVFLNFLQTFIFNFLTSGGHLHANKYLTFHDFSYGLPSLLLSCEIAILAPFFFIAYSPKRYIIRDPTEEGRRHQGYAGGPFGFYAVLSAINVIDIVAILLQAIKGRGENSEYDVPMENDVNAYNGAPGYSQGFGGGRRERRQRRY